MLFDLNITPYSASLNYTKVKINQFYNDIIKNLNHLNNCRIESIDNSQIGLSLERVCDRVQGLLDSIKDLKNAYERGQIDIDFLFIDSQMSKALSDNLANHYDSEYVEQCNLEIIEEDRYQYEVYEDYKSNSL